MENGILKTEIISFKQNLIERIDILNLLIFSIVSSKPKNYNALKIPWLNSSVFRVLKQK